MLHSAKHPSCEGPLNLLLGEHWIIYEYWSKSLMQHQVGAYPACAYPARAYTERH